MAKGKPSIFPRVFLDSGVLLEGLLAPWSASRAVLILSRRKVFRIILAEYVQGKVEDNLRELLAPDPRLGSETINAYSTLTDQMAMPIDFLLGWKRNKLWIKQSQHQTDVPVLVSALKAAPDWFLTTNTRHFTKQVALRTQLKIVTPQEFITSIKILG